MLYNFIYPEQHAKALHDHRVGELYTLLWDREWRAFPQGPDQNKVGFLLTLRTRNDECKNAPYSVELEVFAEAETAVENTRETIEKCAAEMMLGMARERIRMLTSDGPWGSIMLPVFDQPE